MPIIPISMGNSRKAVEDTIAAVAQSQEERAIPNALIAVAIALVYVGDCIKAAQPGFAPDAASAVKPSSEA